MLLRSRPNERGTEALPETLFGASSSIAAASSAPVTDGVAPQRDQHLGRSPISLGPQVAALVAGIRHPLLQKVTIKQNLSLAGSSEEKNESIHRAMHRRRTTIYCELTAARIARTIGADPETASLPQGYMHIGVALADSEYSRVCHGSFP